MIVKNAIKKFCQYTGIPIYFFQNNLFELRLMFVRLYGLLPMQRTRIRKIQRQHSINLNFGCGETSYPGWVGIDSFFANNVDVVLDLRRRLPFKDESIDYCYSEHFLEHLRPDEGIRHLEEVYRILKPKGIYRVVVPAGIRFVEKYLDKDNDFFRLAFPWAERPMDAIYCIVNWGGEHKNIFDFDQLEYLSRQVGFHKLKKCDVNASNAPVLRIDKSSEQRIAESLYVEFIKEG